VIQVSVEGLRDLLAPPYDTPQPSYPPRHSRRDLYEFSFHILLDHELEAVAKAFDGGRYVRDTFVKSTVHFSKSGFGSMGPT